MISAVRDEGGSGPDLVVWPETSVQFALHDETGELPVIAQAGGGATTAFGVRRLSDGKVYNSLAVLAPNGKVTDAYDKWHLVPFGEYVPFGKLISEFGIAGLVEEAGGFSAGPGPRSLDFGAAGRFQVLICYEIVFPREVQDRRAEQRTASGHKRCLVRQFLRTAAALCASPDACNRAWASADPRCQHRDFRHRGSVRAVNRTVAAGCAGCHRGRVAQATSRYRLPPAGRRSRRHRMDSDDGIACVATGRATILTAARNAAGRTSWHAKRPGLAN